MFMLYEYREVKNNLSISILNSKGEGEWEVVGHEGALVRCMKESSEIACGIKKESYLTILFLPIAILWIFLPGLVWAFVWVRSGFKSNST